MADQESVSETSRIALDEQFSCLAAGSRRRILATLASERQQDRQEFEPVDFKPDDVNVRDFETSLHHRHLPRLAEVGLVEWDRDSGTITRGPAFEQIRPLLTLLDENRDELPGDWP